MKLSELLKILEEKNKSQERIKLLKEELQKIQSAEEKKHLESLLQEELESNPQEEKKEEEQEDTEEVAHERIKEDYEKLEETIEREQQEHDLRKELSPLTYHTTSQVDLELYGGTFQGETQVYQGNAPTIEKLANTFIKEGLLTESQQITPDRQDAIMKRIAELNPGASAEKIINYFNAIKEGDFKKEGVYKHKLE